MRDSFAPAWFDAAAAPRGERPVLFARAFRDAVTDLDIEIAHPRDFSGRMLWVALPGARLATCFASGARFVRRACAAPGATGCILLRPVGGRMPVEQCGRSAMLEDGAGVLLSLGAPFSYDASRLARVDHLLVPAGVLPAGAETGPLPLLPAQNNTLRLLVHYAGAVLQGLLPLETEQSARLAGAHMRDLAGAAFGQFDRPPAPAGGDRLARVKAAIAPHLSRRDLSIEMPARALGVSPRAVQKLFEAGGTTFTAYVLACRLEFARELIEDERRGARPAGPVSAIAYEAGFGDLSYFNRSFRGRFGMSPSAYRRRDAEARAPR